MKRQFPNQHTDPRRTVYPPRYRRKWHTLLLLTVALALQALLGSCALPSEARDAPSEPAKLTLEPAASSAWLVRVQERIAADEYVIVTQDDSYAAFNRSHHLQARFDAGGATVEPSAEAGDALTPPIHLALAAWGRAEELHVAEAVTPEHGDCLATGERDARGSCVRRLEYSRPGILEWWENRPDGLEQGWTVEAAPSGVGPLLLEVAIEGALAELDDDGTALIFEGGRLRYSGLAAWDAEGNPLAATMMLLGDRLWIEVDDHDAVWPVTVDPILTTSSWSSSGEASNGHLGASMTSAGDVNGDGYSDVLIGAYGAFSVGKAYLYLGSSEGLSTTASWSASGEANYSGFGYGLAATDINGDGHSDLIISAYGYGDNTGKVYVFPGSTSGPMLAASDVVTGSIPGDYFGYAVSAAGDVNGDGYGDVMVGAFGVLNKTGRTYVYQGSSSGLNTVALWMEDGEQSNGFFGASISSAGDVNGDGFADVLVGAHGVSSSTGKAYVYLGSVSGPGAAAAWTASGEGTSNLFGYAVSSAGDVNADGYADVMVGARQYASYTGKAYVYLGSSTGLKTSAAWSVAGPASGSAFASALASAGDVNGDGYADVIVGAYGYNNSTGQASIYLGCSGGLLSTASWTSSGEATGGGFGVAVSSAGDVNGDGYGDVVVGASSMLSGAGKAYLYLGLASLPGSTAVWSPVGEASSYFGNTVSSAGDVNGDGYGDVLVGADQYSGNTGKVYLFPGMASGLSESASWSAVGESKSSSFGTYLSDAGDVNGDGYGDVIIGARGFSSNTGKAYVYLGSSTGLGSGPAWTASGETTNSSFGSVSSAGDVNGDGYGDVIIGSSNFSNALGKTYLYTGSSAGLSKTPVWTALGPGTGSSFGLAVSSAGDVNGDGLSDVIVGAYQVSSSAGKAFVYLGTGAGLSPEYVWSASGQNSNSYFGGAVSRAGDVNGDGYGDVIIGARNYNDTGKAYLYLGSAIGPKVTSSWSVSGSSLSNYGCSVAAAGDVNGDGYGDILVGASGGTSTSGSAYLYLGKANGPSTAASLSFSYGSNTDFGGSVSSAGDVNGDGYADLLVGASRSSSYAGKAYLYLGNSSYQTGPSPSLRPIAQQPDLTSPLAPLGRSSAQDSMAVSAYSARSAVGRLMIRLQVEVKPLGTAFDLKGLQSSPWGDSGIDGSTLSTVISGLSAQADHRWRARIQYHPSSGAPLGWSRWLYGGVPGEVYGVHVRTACTADTDADGLCNGPDPDGDNDGDPDPSDCSPFDPALSHAAQEVCDGQDNDCDEAIDEGLTSEFYPDSDGDGYGQANGSPVTACSAPGGYIVEHTDCDDANAAIHPGATETCNTLDDDCDGQTDIGATDAASWYHDADLDGYGGTELKLSCVQPEGWLPVSGDCDDGDPAVNPGKLEVCDGVDQDCDSEIDEGVQNLYYADLDGDGFGDSVSTTHACVTPAGYAAQAGDCDPGEATVYPGALEVCDGLDNDCDSEVDEEVQTTFYRDADGDGYGSPGAMTQACAVPTGYSEDSSDCDDGDPSAYPGAPESAGTSKDYNCDGTLEPMEPTPTPTPETTVTPHTSPTPGPDVTPVVSPTPNTSPTPSTSPTPEPSPDSDPSPSLPPTSPPAADGASGCACTSLAAPVPPSGGALLLALGALCSVWRRRRVGVCRTDMRHG